MQEGCLSGYGAGLLHEYRQNVRVPPCPSQTAFPEYFLASTRNVEERYTDIIGILLYIWKNPTMVKHVHWFQDFEDSTESIEKILLVAFRTSASV